MFIPKRKPSLIGILTGITAAVMVLSLVVIYYPSFQTSFWGDDWYNLWIARASSWKEVIGFFNLLRPASDFPFYRPLTTQFFFWLTTAGLTKMNPLPAHIVLFLFFLANGWLVFRLIKELFQDFMLAFLAAFFYLFSATHFYRIYALSQFQEVGLAFFYLWSILSYVKYLQKPKYQYLLFSLGWFFLALLSKESALTLVLILALILVYFRQFKKRWRSLTPFVAMAMIYLLLRILFFGFTVSGDYQLVFNPKSIINTYFWYGIWSLGIPEDLVNLDLFRLPSIINPRILVSFGENGSFAIWLSSMLMLLCGVGVKLLIKHTQQNNNQYLSVLIFGVCWFFLTLLMVAFYPFHKFIYSLTLPLLGTSIILAVLAIMIYDFSKLIFVVLIMVYFFGQKNALAYAHDTHWSIKRGVLSQAMFYHIDHYIGPVEPQAVFYVREDLAPTCRTIDYPLTREVDHAVSVDKAIKLHYGDDKAVYYDYRTPINKLPSGRPIVYEIDVKNIINISRAMGLKI